MISKLKMKNIKVKTTEWTRLCIFFVNVTENSLEFLHSNKTDKISLYQLES